MKSYLIVFLIIVSQVSCKKFIEVDPPADRLTTATIFSDDESANGAVRGIYSDIMSLNNGIANGGMSLYLGLYADEIKRTTASSITDPFQNNALLPSNSTVSSLWTKGYNYIYTCNLILESLSNASGVSEILRKQLTGEVKFFRAFFHFYLLNLYGNIPSAISSDYRINSTIKQVDSATVYSQMIADLKDAQGLLDKAYAGGQKTRANFWAATALLARVYLFQKDWPAAEAEASKIIDSGLFSLCALQDVFKANSTEAILQFYPPDKGAIATAEGFDFVPASSTSIPSYVLQDNLVQAFEPGDLRKTMWTGVNTRNGINYTFPYKYKLRLGTVGSPKSEYNMVLRIAEQYLIRAEARARLDKSTDALADINSIRKRAGLPDFTQTGKTELLEAIFHEKQIELFTEWGSRWMDLKRWGRAELILAPLKGANWQPTDIVFPIPQTEMDANPFLKQNQGY